MPTLAGGLRNSPDKSEMDCRHPCVLRDLFCDRLISENPSAAPRPGRGGDGAEAALQKARARRIRGTGARSGLGQPRAFSTGVSRV